MQVCDVLTQFFEGVLNFKKIIVKLQQFGGCVQSIVSVPRLLWHRVHRNLKHTDIHIV